MCVSRGKMPNKKKNNQRNAFSFYLDETVSDLRKKGDIRSKQDAVPLAHSQWQTVLSDAEKARYEEKAKAWKRAKVGKSRTGRLDNTGCSIDNRVDMDQRRHEQRREQRKFLLDRWQKMRMEEVLDERFYIISFQCRFVFPHEEDCQPVEVACVEFSLRAGISREWHAMIDPGPMLRGMGAESKIFSEQTHQIPIWRFEAARNDHAVLWSELLTFLNPGKRGVIFPPIFTRIEELRKTAECVDYLARLAQAANCLSKIFQWEILPLTLYEHAGVAIPSLTIVEAGATTAMYDYEANTKCDYHHEIECIYCALLAVKKCCFFMSDAFTKIYGFEITESHLPVRQEPQFMVISPQDMYSKKSERKRFYGASAMRKYDSNLPAELQPSVISDISDYESPTASSTYGSRDIRFRRNFRQVGLGSVGRGTVTGSHRPPIVIQNQSDVLSTTDTIDDVGSSVFSDTESEATCQADDEGSVASGGTRRPPLTVPQATTKLEELFAPKVQKNCLGTQPILKQPQVYLSDDNSSEASILDVTEKVKPVEPLQSMDSFTGERCSMASTKEMVNLQLKRDETSKEMLEQHSISDLENVPQPVSATTCQGRLTQKFPTGFFMKGYGIGRGLAFKVPPTSGSSLNETPACPAAMDSDTSVGSSKDIGSNLGQEGRKPVLTQQLVAAKETTIANAGRGHGRLNLSSLESALNNTSLRGRGRYFSK